MCVCDCACAPRDAGAGNMVGMSGLSEQITFTVRPRADRQPRSLHSRHLCMACLEPGACLPFLGTSGSPSGRLH